MEVELFYETSKGIFSTLAEAQKKKNRAKESYDRWATSEYETPRPCYCLVCPEGIFKLTRAIISPESE